jgi:hypothetical protein
VEESSSQPGGGWAIHDGQRSRPVAILGTQGVACNLARELNLRHYREQEQGEE